MSKKNLIKHKNASDINKQHIISEAKYVDIRIGKNPTKQETSLGMDGYKNAIEISRDFKTHNGQDCRVAPIENGWGIFLSYNNQILATVKPSGSTAAAGENEEQKIHYKSITDFQQHLIENLSDDQVKKHISNLINQIVDENKWNDCLIPKIKRAVDLAGYEQQLVNDVTQDEDNEDITGATQQNLPTSINSTQDALNTNMNEKVSRKVVSESSNMVSFLKSFSAKNYAQANKYLEEVISSKIKSRIKTASVEPLFTK